MVPPPLHEQNTGIVILVMPKLKVTKMTMEVSKSLRNMSSFEDVAVDNADGMIEAA